MRYLLLFAPILFFLYSCQKNDEELVQNSSSNNQPYITVIHSPNGLGDRGYNDNLYLGVRACQQAYGFHLSSHSPLNMDEAEQLMVNWMTDTVTTGRRLLVLGSADLEDILRRHTRQIPDPEQGEVLLLESRATDLPLYTIYLPLYGACYQAGHTAVLFPYADKSAVVCANQLEGPVADGARGFKAGFEDNGGTQLDCYYLSENENGYAMADSLYRFCYTLEQDYGFVFPLCGGSSQGLLRFTREYPQTFYTAGMDVDQSDYSSRVVFSVVKHIDRAIYRFLSDWINGGTIPRHQREGLSSGMVEIVVSPNYKEFLGTAVEETKEIAIQKEEAYEQNL